MVPFATQYGDDLTDKQGGAPIVRKIGFDDIDMEKNEDVGLVDEQTIETNVATTVPIEKKDKAVADGEVE